MAKACICGKKLHSGSRTGLCQPCSVKRTLAALGNCSECGATLGRGNKLGRCKPCAIVRSGRIARRDPVIAARLRENAFAQAKANFWNPEARAKWRQSRAEVGRKVREHRIGWCPVAYRAEYMRLAKRGDCNAAKAKAIILEKIHRENVFKYAPDAADYLRRFAPVFRTEEGWRYGIAVLTPAEIVARAELRGWQPSRWAA